MIVLVLGSEPRDCNPVVLEVNRVTAILWLANERCKSSAYKDRSRKHVPVL